jgi:hypothetical protein
MCTHHGTRNDQNQVKLPADLIQRHRRRNERDLTGQVESGQTHCHSRGPQMVGEDLGHVDILCGVDEETPPDDVEPDEEDTRAETGFIVRVEEGSCECT